MRHGPERDAIRYLAGRMSRHQHQAFSEHLVSCQTCWREVQQARAGRALLEQTREAATADLRDRVRATVEAEVEGAAASPTRGRRLRRWLPGAVMAGAAAAAVVVALVAGSPRPPARDTFPPAVQQAVADYSERVLPGTHMAATSAPDLSGLGLEPVGAAAGSYGGLAVDGYSYTDPAGRRVMLYLSDHPFPRPAGADPLGPAGGPWMAHSGQVVVLCAMLPGSLSPRAALVIGSDDELVTAAARTLGAPIGPDPGGQGQRRGPASAITVAIDASEQS